MLKRIFPKNRLLQFLFYHGEKALYRGKSSEKVLYREKSRLDIELLDEELYVEIFKF